MRYALDMRKHIVAIAIIHLFSGGLGLLIWLGGVLVSCGAAGALATEDPFGGFVTGSIFLYVMVAVLGLAIVPSLLAGWGLLKSNQVGKWMAVILAIFSLPAFPIGTALSVWTLWALLSEEGARSYRMGG